MISCSSVASYQLTTFLPSALCVKLADPSKRPSFEECMHELENAVRIEVSSGDFRRTTHANAVASAATTDTPKTRLRGISGPSKHQPAEVQPKASEVTDEHRSSARDAHLFRSSQAFRAFHPAPHSHQQGTNPLPSRGTATANPCHEPEGTAADATSPAQVEAASVVPIAEANTRHTEPNSSSRPHEFSDI